MKITVSTEPSISSLMQREYQVGEAAVTRAMRGAASRLKQDWRGQVTSAGLGRRLGNTVRGQAYPSGTNSIDAAALVWTKAPKIIAAHEEGALITSKDGFWLAIPLEAAGRGRQGKRLTPGEWEQRNGTRLRFVYRPGRTALLVADDARVSKGGLARRKRGRRRKSDNILTGAQTVPVFVLVPQVKLRKRLNLYDGAERVASGLPGAIASGWKG